MKMKILVQRILRLLGYDIKRYINAFEVQQELIKNTKPVIFDVGAHLGKVTEVYRNLFPTAVIHSFEPFPMSFQQLKENHSKDSNVKVHNLGISDKIGVSILNVNTLSGANSLLPTDSVGSSYWGEGMLETKEQVEVNITTIDTFCREENISKIDILKLDVQGNELKILTGAKQMLSNQAISLIYSEIILVPTYEGQSKLNEYLSFFDSHGYDLFDLYNTERKGKKLIQADFLFVNSYFQKELLWE